MRFTYGPFVTWLIVAALAFGIAAGIRGCDMNERSVQIGKARNDERDRQWHLAAFRELEGKTSGPLTVAANAIRAIKADPKYKELTFEEIDGVTRER